MQPAIQYAWHSGHTIRGHILRDHTLRGYTLLELLTILAIIAILASSAMPDLGKFVQAHAGQIFIHELARTLSMARTTAVTSGSIVTLCRSRDGLACNGTWDDGMLLFTDHNSDRIPNGNDLLLQHSRGIEGSLRLRSFPNRQYVQFTPLGFTNKQNGSFTWCPPGQAAELAQQLIFSQSGRTRLARDANGDGLREGTNGGPLTCN